jgi:hypothetical protein
MVAIESIATLLNLLTLGSLKIADAAVLFWLSVALPLLA